MFAYEFNSLISEVDLRYGMTCHLPQVKRYIYVFVLRLTKMYVAHLV